MKQKRKKCKNCKKYFKQVYSTLQVCCSTKCAIEYSKKKANKVKKDLEDAKIQDANKKTLQTLKNNVMNACHKYIRLRDKNKHCISCLPLRIGKERTEKLILRAEESKKTIKKFSIEELKEIQLVHNGIKIFKQDTFIKLNYIAT